ncbi:type 1 periplasmic-binding domain-containing protein [Sphaerisporangium aureirubrum]|uniref:LacI family transcriptional regulator n=1 Tax=Sphaerisporangium aureirubrum TaxID=1544736 RepID=A0ABW1NML5_9ACTN
MAEHTAPPRRGTRAVAHEAGVSGATVANVLNRPGIVAPATHLIALGHHRIAFLCSAPTVATTVKERYAGLRDAVADAGLDPGRVVVEAEIEPRRPTYDLGYAAADLLLHESGPGHRHREVLFEPSLVVRDSTRAV